jgi:Zn-finger nucleic acid-binding protein
MGFYATERRRMRRALAVCFGGYLLALLVLWLYLFLKYPSHYAGGSSDFFGNSIGGQSFVSWLAPWFRNLALLGAVLFALWAGLIWLFDYRDRRLCVRCKGVMTHGRVTPDADEELSPLDDDGAAAMCTDCQHERWEAQLLAEAEARQVEEVAKGLLVCPTCHVDMKKELVRFGDVIIIVDVCSLHGGFYSDEEIQLITEFHYDRGYSHGYARAEREATKNQSARTAMVVAISTTTMMNNISNGH